MLYVSVAPNGYAMVSTIPPSEGVFYVEVETLPEGEGPLMLANDGTLYRLEPTPEPTNGPTVEERVSELEHAIEAGLMLYEEDLGNG